MNEKIAVYDEKMQKSIRNLETELNGIRAGRANPHVLDKITVNYYGTPTPIQQVANVTIPEARIIQIQPWEPKMVREISRAIMASDLGINPADDGSTVRLVFPELTEERRKMLVKDVRKKGEDAKVAVRNVRRDGNDMLKKLKKDKESGISEDGIKDLEDELQKMADKAVKEIDGIIAKKSDEILTV